MGGALAAQGARPQRGTARQRHRAQPRRRQAGAVAERACVVVERVCGAAAELLEQALQHVQRRVA